MNGQRKGSGRCHADGAMTNQGQRDYSTLTAKEKRQLWATVAVSFAALLAANAVGVM